jgi:Tfp pilus assembly protein PilF
LFDIDVEMSSYRRIDPNQDNSFAENEQQAYELYNDAIGDLAAGNEDIAFIKLKKAVGIKPDFFSAKLLTGLHYAKTGNIKKAGAAFEEVISGSREFGEIALRYIRLLNANQDKKDKDSMITSHKDSEAPKAKANVNKPLLFLAGFLAGILICIPLMLKSQPEVIEDDSEEIIASLELDIDRYKEKISQLEQIEPEIKEVIETIIVDITDEQRQEIIESTAQKIRTDFLIFLEIMELHRDNRIIEATDKMIALTKDNAGYSEAVTGKLIAYEAILRNEAARYCEDRGVYLYGQKKYTESMGFLDKTTYYSPNYSRMYRVLYYKGMNALVKKNYEAARELFLEVIEKAPNNDWVGYAQLRLSEIEAATEDD